MIKVALPNKGMLFDPTMELIKACGYKANKQTKSLSSVDSANNIEFFFLRPSDIPMYVGRGIIDAGITGIDFNAESHSPAIKVLDLPYGASKHCAAVPNNSSYQSLSDLAGLRLATSFPHIVQQYYQNYAMELVVLEGAVEISVNLGIADAVVDVVETGTTLKQAGLRILGEPLFRSNAALFAHPDKQNDPDVRTIIRRIEGKLVAMSYMMIEYNAPISLLDQARAITPGLESPTISSLHNPDWVAIKAMVDKDQANAIMDKLWDLGCKSILLSSIKTARI